MQSLGHAVLLQGEDNPCLVAGVEAQHPQARGPLPACQTVPISQAHGAAAVLCTGLERALPELQGRLRASFAMQRDHRDKSERWINTQLDRQTDGFCRR